MRSYARAKEEPTDAEIERTLTSIRTDLMTQATQEASKWVDVINQAKGKKAAKEEEKDDGPNIDDTK